MPETLSSFTEKVSGLIQDQAPLLTLGFDLADSIRQGLEAYSLDHPRELVADVAGDGTTFDLTLPAGFVSGFSVIRTVEFPAGERLPVYLDPDIDYALYRTDAATFLRLANHTPATGQETRIAYTALHTIDQLDEADETTIPAYHTEAFAYLAASKALYRLATRFLHEQESSYEADVVNRDTKADQARRLANAFAQDYRQMTGITTRGAAVQMRVNWDSSIAGTGVGLLTHGRRR